MRDNMQGKRDATELVQLIEKNIKTLNHKHLLSLDPCRDWVDTMEVVFKKRKTLEFKVAWPKVWDHFDTIIEDGDAYLLDEDDVREGAVGVLDFLAFQDGTQYDDGPYSNKEINLRCFRAFRARGIFKKKTTRKTWERMGVLYDTSENWLSYDADTDSLRSMLT